MPITKFLRRKLNDHVFGKTTYTAPDVLYLGLLTGTPTVGGSYTEASYTGYSRITVNNNKTTFSNSSDINETEIVNNIEIFFNTMTAGSPVNVTAIGIFDAASGGNFLGWGNYSKTIETGDRLVVPIGGLKIKFID